MWSIAFRLWTPEIISKMLWEYKQVRFLFGFVLFFCVCGVIIIIHQIVRVVGPKTLSIKWFSYLKNRNKTNQVMDSRQWPIWLPISQKQSGLKTVGLPPAPSKGPCLLWSPSCLMSASLDSQHELLTIRLCVRSSSSFSSCFHTALSTHTGIHLAPE